MSNKYKMTEDFEILGLFYLPSSNYETGIKGTLHFSCLHQITLKLTGVLEDDFIGSFDMGITSHDVILGITEKGDKITLHKCVARNRRFSTKGFATEIYAAERFYIGDIFVENEDENLFENSRFSFTFLDAWMEYNVLERHIMFYDKDKKRTKQDGLLIDFESLDKKSKIKIQDDIYINEEFECTIKQPESLQYSETMQFIINRHYMLSSITDTLLSSNTIEKYIHGIRTILALFVGKPIHDTFIEFSLPSEDDIKSKCRLFVRQNGEPLQPKAIGIDKNISLQIRRENVINNFGVILTKWFNDRDRLSDIILPYVSSQYLSTYAENKFLNVTRSLESFHRFYVEREGGDLLEPDKEKIIEKQLIIDYINLNVSEANRDNFIEKISYPDEDKFRKRLNDLFRMTPEKLIERLFGKLNKKDRKYIIATIVDTRNYYTHYDTKSKYRFLIDDNGKLSLMIRRLEIILQYHFFVQIGLEADTVVNRLLSYSGNTYAFVSRSS